MKNDFHIQVEQGEDSGKTFTVPQDGARLGRSSKNDIVLVDPMLSRHHCRLFFKEDGLWITDLGSANETLLNGKPTFEAPLHCGDRITIGDTVLVITQDGRAATAGTPTPAAGPVDLGLSGDNTIPRAAPRRIGLGPLLTVLCIVVAATVGIFLHKALNRRPPPPPPIPLVAPKLDQTLTVDYEKVEASDENIFHYHLTISPERVLSIAIDDLQNNRTVRESKAVDASLIEGLAEDLAQSGFFELDEKYEGVNPNVLEQRTISITIGADTLQARVLNRVEPDVFTVVRQKLEDFGRVELGLWAIQFSTEKLLTMANDAYLLGKKLYAERLVALGNLSAAIKSFDEAEWYLETVEEKPEFYADILASRTTCQKDLTERYEEQNFQAERAIRLREWASAASELRILMELIPDREDARHIEARKKLVEVDARVESLK
jgi:hypothetical protein